MIDRFSHLSPMEQAHALRSRQHEFVAHCVKEVSDAQQQLGDAEAALIRARIRAREWDELLAKLDGR